jgi:hypothetical protein
MTPIIKKELFKDLLSGIVPTFSGSFKAQLPEETEIVNIFFNSTSEIATVDELLKTQIEESSNLEAIKYRIAAVWLILYDFHEHPTSGDQIKTELIWPLIYKSLISLDGADILATIGSQGFLSIPLYHQDKKNNCFEFLRLHIWDKSFMDYIDWEKTNTFSIHSHQFNAQSRVLLGEIGNRRYKVDESALTTDHSFFRIEWNNLEDVNQKTSNAVNTGKFVSIELSEGETYKRGATYEIIAGEFHKSEVEIETTSATLFLFSSQKGKVEKSFVIGPATIETSTVNRKVVIDPKPILEKLNHQINYERAD